MLLSQNNMIENLGIKTSVISKWRAVIFYREENVEMWWLYVDEIHIFNYFTPTHSLNIICGINLLQDFEVIALENWLS